MSTLDKLTSEVRESFHALAEGWHDVWDNARNAITRFTPSHDDEKRGSNRWGLLSADLKEDSDVITVSIEAPGLDKDEFAISLDGRSLRIRGVKQYSSSRNEGHYHITERAYGRFERQFHLPADVNEKATKAVYKNGVLTIELSKSVSDAPKLIKVETE